MQFSHHHDRENQLYALADKVLGPPNQSASACLLREIFIVLGTGLSPGFVAGILLALSSVSPTAVRPSVGLTDATSTLESTEDLDIERNSEAISKDRRIRDIELQLAAAHRQEEKERRYQ